MKVKGAFSGPLRSWQSLEAFFVKLKLTDFFGSPGQNSGHWYFLRLHPHHQRRTLALVGSRLHSWHLGKWVDTGRLSETVQIWTGIHLRHSDDGSPQAIARALVRWHQMVLGRPPQHATVIFFQLKPEAMHATPVCFLGDTGTKHTVQLLM